MRDKQRYLLVESSFRIADADPKRFGNSLYPELRKTIGEMIYHRINPKVVKLAGERRFVVKSTLAGSDDLILALTLTKSFGASPAGFYTLKSSGTIKALMKFEN